MGDCCDCRSCFEVAKGCDVVIHESTYGEEMKAMAIPRGHATAKMAARSAIAMKAKMLMLTHFSSRYVEGDGAEGKECDGDEEERELLVEKLQKEAEEEVR